MATLKLYLDTRRVAKDGAPLKLRISKNSQTVLYSLGVKISVDEWDASAAKIIKSPRRKILNDLIAHRSYEIKERIFQMETETPGITVKEIARRLSTIGVDDEADAVPLFLVRMRQYADKAVKPRTGQLYLATVKRICAFDPDAESLRFEDITVKWLRSFDEFLAKTSPGANARAIHFRNIRTIFNEAIDDEVTVMYPFRKFKIKSEATRKRSLSVDALRKIFTADNLTPRLEKYRDIFKLIFMLIGINVVDLCHLQEIIDGRVEYVRAKTYRRYSVKVEPEVMELIQKYKGQKYLLDFMDTHKHYRSFYMTLCNGLAAVKDQVNEIQDGIVLSELTTYWARHTWATIAASLDVSKETIAAALGHGGNTVTDIYIDFDQRKVDDANRRVLDWVLYGKR